MRGAMSAVLALLPVAASAQVAYDRHVLFDNSIGTGSYHYSDGSVVAPSELELVNGKWPIEDTQCVTPPNCLRLTWRSQRSGDWRITLRLRKHYTTVKPSGDTLSFWAYADGDLVADASPLVQVTDEAGVGSPTIRLLESVGHVPARKWVRIQLPFDSFASLFGSTNDVRFDPTRLANITIMQGLDDGAPHTLYVDEVMIGDDASREDRVSPAAPTGLHAKGYDRHVDLTWQAGKEPDLQHYKIYRSFDGKTFTPVAIQKGSLTRYADFVGESGKTASYRISAVDASYNESPRSEEVTATTRAMSDDELLTMVQEASFRYYWEAAHPQAGMAIEILPGDDNLVALGT